MGLKPIGSEKLEGQDKINRIMEIANYGNVEKNVENHTQTTSFLKEGKDGNVYAIVQEKDGYHLKSGLNESDLDYIDGLRNKNKNRFKSYSAALKRMNLIFKPINEQYNEGVGDNMYGEIEDQEERFTLKTPDAPADEDEIPMDDEMDMGDDDMDMGDEEMGMDDDMDMEDEELGMDSEEGGEEEMEGVMKSIQKLTGKLGQKLRDGEEELESEDVKYVINSVLSALDLDKLEDEDKEDILSRFEDDETEYGDEELEGGDVDLEDDMDMEDEEMEMDMEDEEMEMDMEDEEVPMESLKKRISNLLESYVEEKDPKTYIKEVKKNTKVNNIIEKHSNTVDQELSAKKFIKENKATIKGLTKGGAILMISEGKKVYINKNGSIR